MTAEMGPAAVMSTQGGAGRWPVPFVELAAVRAGEAPRGRSGSSLLPGLQVLVMDETAGGTRSHKRPAAEAVVRAAAAAGFEQVTVGSCGNYGWEVARAARGSGIEATVVVPAEFTVDVGRLEAAGARVLPSGATYEEAVATSRWLAGPLCADGNVDGPFSGLVLAAHRQIVDRIAGLPGPPPTAVWVPLGNGPPSSFQRKNNG